MTDEAYRTEHFGLDERTAQSARDVMDILVGNALAISALDLDTGELRLIKPMIAMPFHPSNVYTIDELNANLADILHDVEQKALVSLDGAVDYSLQDKIKNGKFYVEQGIIAGCAGGGFENICAAADIIKGKNIGADEFTFSVYPASTPIYMELVQGDAALLYEMT